MDRSVAVETGEFVALELTADLHMEVIFFKASRASVTVETFAMIESVMMMVPPSLISTPVNTSAIDNRPVTYLDALAGPRRFAEVREPTLAREASKPNCPRPGTGSQHRAWRRSAPSGEAAS